MDRVLRVVQMNIRDKMAWFFIPFIVLFASFFVNILVALLIREPEGFASGGGLSIFVYMLIAGILCLSQTFSMAISFSVRRKDYFWGTAATAGIVSLVVSLILVILSIIEQSTNGWGVKLRFYLLPFMDQTSPLELGIVFFLILLSQFFCGFIFASVHRRIGRNGLLLFSIGLGLVLMILGFVITYFKWWGNVYEYIQLHTLLENSVWLLPFIVITMFASYLLLRKATV
ncbi:hypothetical protein NV379_09075 [Paenibacillus sp. N1-5-1-14]|uniref:hypothetical protein n=1 Tax=Paenibacillus radicibacter TaxID=2972488 RepID=UPI002159A303|nr:hypothetical protein [Paenibacillus radicibacter]MCR8642812.1 hypothetical protein [Paenibacillus radicibacter]